MDGWRGSRLGYAGGRTGYFANYGNNDALRGTMGSSFNNAFTQQAAWQSTTTGVALALGLVAAYAYRDDLKKKARKFKKDAGKAVDRINPLS